MAWLLISVTIYIKNKGNLQIVLAVQVVASFFIIFLIIIDIITQ